MNDQEHAVKAFNELVAPAFETIPADIQIQLLAFAATERLFAMEDTQKAERLRGTLISMFEKLSFAKSLQ